jgi:hypothetical protein
VTVVLLRLGAAGLRAGLPPWAARMLLILFALVLLGAVLGAALLLWPH